MAPRTGVYDELRCPACSWRETCGLDAMVMWLQKARRLRRGREPDAEVLRELFRVSAGRFTCPRCGRQGLSAGPAADQDAAWPDVVPCELCSKPIARERLEAVPGTRLCAACQQAEEQGRPSHEPDYCPRCGAPMAVRPTRSAGITRYMLACTGSPPCRR